LETWAEITLLLAPAAKDKNSTSSYSYLEQSNGNHYSSIVFKSFSTKEIISTIKSLKTKNSFCYDGISTKLLKLVAAVCVIH